MAKNKWDLEINYWTLHSDGMLSGRIKTIKKKFNTLVETYSFIGEHMIKKEQYEKTLDVKLKIFIDLNETI